MSEDGRLCFFLLVLRVLQELKVPLVADVLLLFLDRRFPPPKVFTNALLYNDDITSLIRDTEAHERALFSVPAPLPTAKAATTTPSGSASTLEGGATGADAAAAASSSSSRRRQTVFNVAAGEVTTGPPSARPSAAPRRQTAVAAVLGGDLHAQIAQRGGGGDVDINMLLKGAEKLCSVYALPGALERIPALRQKHTQQSNTLTYYETKVAEQAQRLEDMNRDWRDGDDEDNDDSTAAATAAPVVPDVPTEDDLRHEEQEIRELERRKKELQERLRAMDKDLGGLLNM